MYGRYRSFFNPSFDYPSYSYSYNPRYNFDRSGDNDSSSDGYSSPYWNEYYYGRARRTPYYWERDSIFGRRGRRRRHSSEEKPEEERPETPPKPVRTEPPKEELAKKLNVLDIDLHIPDNTLKHKTDDYMRTKERKVDGNELPAELVIRRGDSFKVTLKLDRPYSNENNDVKINFALGKDPVPTRGTEAEFEVDETGNGTYKADEWGANKLAQNGNEISLQIFVPANCIIGEWTLTVKSYASGKDKDGNDTTLVFRYELDTDIAILFNPWCKDDGTYMEKRKPVNPDNSKETYDLEEYVLNPSGCVYRGNAFTRGAKPWNFGQFEEGILDVSFSLVRKGFGEKNIRAMSQPLKVARMIAKMVNSSDDGGVLTGNWSGDYTGGTRPTAWVGSVKILQEYRKTGRPVNFGQCWVFSCVTTTVCRALGIPCRSVTNFASAHDTDGSLTIDKHFDSEAEPLEHLNSDSIWNFHVWNDVWLARPDLEPSQKYDGWQAIDATPQEASEGVYTCGPAPLSAIKEGLCDTNFDSGFVFAEVNGDVVHWEKLPNGQHKCIKIVKRSVGMKMSTKIPDGKPYQIKVSEADKYKQLSEVRRFDVTHMYKFKEGSEEERRAVMMAHKTASRPKSGVYTEEPEKQELKFQLKHSNEVMIGSDLDIEFVVTNNKDKDAIIKKPAIKVANKTYTGQIGRVFYRTKLDTQVVESGKSYTWKDTLTVENYLPHLIEQANLYIEGTAVIVNLTGGNERILKTHEFRFRRPDLDVESPSECKLGKPVEFKVSFTNPLPKPLVECKISMESAAFDDIEDESVDDVPANGLFEKKFKLVPNRIKEHSVAFSFDCKTLMDIAGSDSITVLP
ncbi:TGM1-like protein [Mya arenaria]|uniref:TGM1-like protein n=1 Tax=Mya arenaria TaxID=6604 RepID=A0ABY7EVQ5_MYAAR|nr:protein-glutamine gamma-glutamyltransferase K-like [Mya arenaria]XP_052819045.1 protein-glutamine gamma-glutamyltransferase K-like [Mya arenaria]XP_052819046.1 protein-glutamine gamma-glutamyltransferase K-like [Mya arenaria]WAR12901.1 TGM1-like protein [Mya arenaria]